MPTTMKIKQKKPFWCRKKVKKMPSLVETLRTAKMKENEKNSRIKSTENNNCSKHIMKNYSSTDISENRELRTKPDTNSTKNSSRRKSNSLLSACKTERKPIDLQTNPLFEQCDSSQTLDKNPPSKEITHERSLQDKTKQNASKLLFVSLDFLEDCQKYTKKFIKPMCGEDLKNLRKNLRNISSYHKRYLSDKEENSKPQKDDRTCKQTIKSSKDMPAMEMENISPKNLEENKIPENESPKNELNADVNENEKQNEKENEKANEKQTEKENEKQNDKQNEKQNEPTNHENIMTDLGVPNTQVISMNESFNVTPSSEDVSTVDKKYIELLLAIANCNKTKENVNLNDSIERDNGLRQREKKIIDGKTFFENKKKEKPVKDLKSAGETEEKILEKTSHDGNDTPIASQENTVLTRLVRDMTKSEVQIQHKNNNTKHSRRFLEIEKEKKTAYSKPEVSENRKKRKTRNKVLKNNNEEVIEMSFPGEVTKGSDVKELWRRETRNKSENSLSSQSSSIMLDKKENVENENSGLDSYKILRKIVEAEVKTICKKFVEDVFSDQEISITAEKNSQGDEKSGQSQNVCEELPAKMDESVSEIFETNVSKTDGGKVGKEERRKKDDLLEYLHKCTDLDVKIEERKKKCPSDTVKRWSILQRLENAFLALGTPTFPNKARKCGSISKMMRKSDPKKNVKAKPNEESLYNRSKRLQKKDISGTMEKKELLGMKEKKTVLKNKPQSQQSRLGSGEKKNLLGNKEKENVVKRNEKSSLLTTKKHDTVLANTQKKNLTGNKEKETVLGNNEKKNVVNKGSENPTGTREQKNLLRNKEKSEVLRNKERKTWQPKSPKEQPRNGAKETHTLKHPPASKPPLSPRNKSAESETKRSLKKEKPQETKNTKNTKNITQSEAGISPPNTTECEDKMKQKKSKTQVEKSTLTDMKTPRRVLSKSTSIDAESKNDKNDEKPGKNKIPDIKTSNSEKVRAEESKPGETEVVKLPERTISSMQNEDENLERKKTFDVIPVDVSSKIKAGKSKSCNGMDDTLFMDVLRNRYPPGRNSDHRATHFLNFSEESHYKTCAGLHKIKPASARKMFVKGKPLRHIGRSKTVNQKDRLRENHEHIMKSLKYYTDSEKKSEEATPVEDPTGQMQLEMETLSNRVVKERSILSIRGSPTQGKNFLCSQGKSVSSFVLESEPVEELIELPRDTDIEFPMFASKKAIDNENFSHVSTCTFDVKKSNHDYICMEDNSPTAISNDESIKDTERPEELSSFSSLSVYTSEQADIEDDEKEYLNGMKVWERDMRQYRALVKEIMSHYRRIDGFLKEDEHSQSLSSDCISFSSKETIGFKTITLFDDLKEINIEEYRRKILSEYEALPIFEYKSKIQQRTGNTKLDERRRNLHFVRPLKTEMDIDVKDFKPNMQKILDSELYVDTENLFKRKELLSKSKEKKSSLQDILVNKTEKMSGDEDCPRSISTPKTFPMLSRLKDYSYSTEDLLTNVRNNCNFGLETVLLKI